MPRKYHILVCKGPECGERRRSIDVLLAFEQALKTCPIAPNEAVLEQYSCFGRCQKGPNVLVREMRPNENLRMILLMPTAQPGAHLYHAVKPEEAPRIVKEHVAEDRPLLELTKRTAVSTLK